MPAIRDAVLSPDGATLYALGPRGLRAYNLAALLAGDARPAWEVDAARFERLALNGDRAAGQQPGIPGATSGATTAATGRELARAALDQDYPDGLARCT